ncbi:hypothetical protein G7Y79_00028g062910 [Physcia stellaris]|nr:hypothetical protein G7Y79_00028g062910 [Physcia stellaris]
MHPSVLLFAPALLSLLVASSPVPQQKTAKLATRSTPYRNPNFWRPLNPKTWEKIHQRQTDDVDIDVEELDLKTRSTPFHNPKFWRPKNPKAFQNIHQRDEPTSTTVTPSAANATTVPSPTTNSTAAASATPVPTDDESSTDPTDPSNDPSAADEDLVWVDDDDEDSYLDKRHDTSATDEDSDDDVVYHYLYDEREAAGSDSAPVPEADKREVVSKREVDYDEDLDYLFDDGTAAEDF